MKKTLVFLCAVLLAWGVAGQAEATLFINESGPGLGSARVSYEGTITYNIANGWSGDLEGTIVEKKFESLGQIAFAVMYDGDLDWSSGFRWTEQITNSTGVSWTDYDLSLTTGGLFFSDAIFSPALVDVDFSGSNPVATKLYSWGTLMLSDDQKSLSFYFNTPIASGETFGVHAPIEGLSNPSGKFQLVQNPTPVPEPATMLLLGSGLIGLAGLGRKKFFRK